jgi:hypothetical protein
MPTFTQQLKKVLPDGEYPARVIDAKVKFTQKGDEKIVLSWSVKNGSDTMEITSDLIFVDDWFGFPRITQFVSATGDAVQDGESATLEIEDCVGRECVLVIGHDEWQGTARNTVICYKPLPPDPEPLPKEDPDNIPY